jgi:hypothetical protein
MMDFDLVYKSDGTTGIGHVLADYTPIPVPPEELERARQQQEFCSKRAQQLHDQGVGALYEANTTILRELHREALRKAHSTNAPTNEPNPISDPAADALPAEEPTAKPPLVRSTLTNLKAEKHWQQLCHDPDIVCEHCGSGDFDSKRSNLRGKSERIQILICDCCDRGYHNSCLGLKWQLRAADGWYCPSCLVPGTEIEVQRTSISTSRSTIRLP